MRLASTESVECCLDRACCAVVFQLFCLNKNEDGGNIRSGMHGWVFSDTHGKRQRGIREGVAPQSPSEELHWLARQMAPRITSCGGSDTVGMKRRATRGGER